MDIPDPTERELAILKVLWKHGEATVREVYEELRQAFRALHDEADVRAIVLTGSGKGFCSGGDVEDIIGRLFERDMRGLLEFTRMTCDLVLSIRQCRKPVIAALNGTVAGAGAVIATACDMRVASESAKIAYLFTRVGLSGADMGAAWMLPRIVGLAKASELLMTGDFISAGDQFGRVTERGLFHTEIQTETRDLTTVPNLFLVTHPVTTVRSSGTTRKRRTTGSPSVTTEPSSDSPPEPSR